MKTIGKKLVAAGVLFLLLQGNTSCSKHGDEPVPVDTTIDPPVQPVFDINSISDTYESLAPFANYLHWGSYNVHDPSVIKVGEYYYCYSTDAGFGISVRSGIQIRRSKDLVVWEYMGWVFNALPAQGAAFIQSKGGTAFDALWAPYVLKSGNEYRLYYSLSSAKPRLSVIGMATASSPMGPWTEKGLVVTSLDDASIQTNAIDPSVITLANGNQYLYYGSAWDGIYVLQLNAATGLALKNADKGKRIANRGFTDGRYNGNIEGAEIIYNAAQQQYYLFIAYDWLQTKYNVRVCRSANPEGPFYDFNGKDANSNEDHGPMILAPYQFEGHAGWQGVAHCSVFQDGNGQYFIAHQGRPVVNSYYMDLHVRKIFWTPDGWPVVSPERFAWEDNAVVDQSMLPGSWEKIELMYSVVPGYADEQKLPDLQVAKKISIDVGGTLNGEAGSSWTYQAPWLEMKWKNGGNEKVLVQKGRDWENRIQNSLIFTGLNNEGTAVWGKKH
ncbi:arabinan endo-1,5-alpha-L-arabinosidase [Flavihumibacter petaseus]|uniref:Putative glycosidase n=1 Tax=Flavihumibacter petaseus NBRC 106054 TaxID=1220578 RepID=A0A0E9N2K1_9BACT|nr:arabinan endo-1,5-alpha-L-arabinosidase [Flavihumibacter petaseus]GAO43866.1 putative glycosidase [Flavihumibacter petaseus NBRC 106054]